MNNELKLRKLLPEEHVLTKSMWRNVFADESESFLDYYYNEKIKDNEIYVIEDGDKIVSMIQLNPYKVRVGLKEYKLHYIVGVATEPSYRRRGLMAKLLNHTMNVMGERGEPFTYLMPAAKEIYEPFGFEFVCMRSMEGTQGEELKNNPPEVVEATENDCEAMAVFANEYLRDYDVVVIRDASYYQRLLLEFRSEKGGILLAKRKGQITGIMHYARGEGYEVNEALFTNDEDFKHCLYQIAGNATVSCKVNGGGKEKPSIMAKVLRGDFEMDLKSAKVFINEWV